MIWSNSKVHYPHSCNISVCPPALVSLGPADVISEPFSSLVEKRMFWLYNNKEVSAFCRYTFLNSILSTVATILQTIFHMAFRYGVGSEIRIEYCEGI
jgi:hypothetical protein